MTARVAGGSTLRVRAPPGTPPLPVTRRGPFARRPRRSFPQTRARGPAEAPRARALVLVHNLRARPSRAGPEGMGVWGGGRTRGAESPWSKRTAAPSAHTRARPRCPGRAPFPSPTPPGRGAAAAPPPPPRATAGAGSLFAARGGKDGKGGRTRGRPLFPLSDPGLLASAGAGLRRGRVAAGTTQGSPFIGSWCRGWWSFAERRVFRVSAHWVSVYGLLLLALLPTGHGH